MGPNCGLGTQTVDELCITTFSLAFLNYKGENLSNLTVHVEVMGANVDSLSDISEYVLGGFSSEDSVP